MNNTKKIIYESFKAEKNDIIVGLENLSDKDRFEIL